MSQYVLYSANWETLIYSNVKRYNLKNPDLQASEIALLPFSALFCTVIFTSVGSSLSISSVSQGIL